MYLWNTKASRISVKSTILNFPRSWQYLLILTIDADKDVFQIEILYFIFKPVSHSCQCHDNFTGFAW